MSDYHQTRAPAVPAPDPAPDPVLSRVATSAAHPRDDRGDDRFEQRGRRPLLDATAALLVLGVMYLRLPYGFGATYQDEGFHLGLATRHAFGDLPFRDESLVALRAFDVVSGPIMGAFPDASALTWRWFGFLLQALTIVGSLALLRRVMPRHGLAPLAVAMAFFAPYDLWVPWYTSLGPLIALLSVALWLHAGTSRGPRGVWALAGIGGACFALCALVYTPLVAALVLPLAALALPWGAATRRLRTASAAWLIGLLAGLALIVLAMHTTGLDRWLLVSMRELREVPEYRSSIVEAVVYKVRHSGFFRSTMAVAILFPTLGVAWARLGGYRRLGDGAGLLALLGWAAIGFLFIRQTVLTPTPLLEPRWLMLLSLALALFAIAAAAAQPRAVLARPALAAAVLLLLWGTGIGAIVAAASASGVRAFFVANWIVWPGAFAVLAAVQRVRGGQDRSPAVALSGVPLALLLVAVSMVYLLGWSYDDAPPWRLHARFVQPRLRGIISTPERVREYDGLVSAVRSRAQRGSFLLAFDDLWWINYLTDTRPALRSALVAAGRFPPEMEDRWLREMDSAGRTPALVVTRRPPEGNTPFERFIRDDYVPDLRLGELQLWTRRVEAGAVPTGAPAVRSR